VVIQVGDGTDIERLRQRLGQAQCVVVLKPERAGHHHAVACQQPAQLRVAGRIFRCKNLVGQRAGVFDVGVDFAAGQRIEHQPCAAEGTLMTGRNA
jgi:hypothetical protein